ncbi:cold shock and DUF1294 domain-containing protein [Shewanella algidipiscicola]|uniref:DNA-binding protein n=1 Tax=Shewanella algidipiscicola TaxID=614070 RepID=A0ABQ4PDF3_9GAMM|nr:cold shock and DUF1294 domain-containing protein [Shewanella algidipiscicola]GIU45556.1 DNA-binding protein [Shewanella algidipiscicola]
MKPLTGTLVNWNNDKGYGFIQPDNGSERLFVHISSLGPQTTTPKLGVKLHYQTSKDKQGRSCALIVDDKGAPVYQRRSKVNTKAKHHKRKAASGVSGQLGVRLLLISALFIGLFLASLMQRLPIGLILYYLLASLITYLAYAQDKQAAQTGQWRIKENSLQLLSLIGGWPGALLGQHSLRHKSKKVTFRLGLWLMVLLNSTLLIWLVTDNGQAMLKQWLR